MQRNQFLHGGRGKSENSVYTWVLVVFIVEIVTQSNSPHASVLGNGSQDCRIFFRVFVTLAELNRLASSSEIHLPLPPAWD